MTAKERYIRFCETTDEFISVFNQPWWLDAVSNGTWNVSEVLNGTQVLAAMPYITKKRGIFSAISLPVNTQYFQLIISYPEGQSIEKQISMETQRVSELLENLPNVDYFYYPVHPNFQNILPFTFNGYEVSVRVSYVLEDISNPEKVFSEFGSMKRRNIKKAGKTVAVNTDLPVEDFYSFHAKCLDKGSKTIGYSLPFLKRAFAGANEGSQGKSFYAKDRLGNIHAALFIIWDEQRAYNLITPTHPEFRNSGAMSLLVYEAIKYVSGKTKFFDFEGSIIPSVEKSYRSFGARQQNYLVVSKTRSKILKLRNALK